MILAAIGHHYHWPRAELEALTDRDARFWHAAAAAFWDQVKQSESG